MMLTANVSAEVQGLNVTEMQGMLSSGINRIGHAAGHNYSRQIRQAVLYDFRKTELERTQEEPPNEDMWRDWPGIKALEAK